MARGDDRVLMGQEGYVSKRIPEKNDTIKKIFINIFSRLKEKSGKYFFLRAKNFL